jgi:hypothetical protein
MDPGVESSRSPHSQVAMHLLDGSGALADSRSYALHCSMPYVAGSEDPRSARFLWQGWSVKRPVDDVRTRCGNRTKRRVRSWSSAASTLRSLSTASNTDFQFHRGAASLGLPARFWHERLIGVAPQPVLLRLHRADDLMLWSVLAGVAAGVLVLRGVAATHLAVGHAHAQVNPGITKLQTLLTAGR